MRAVKFLQGLPLYYIIEYYEIFYLLMLIKPEYLGFLDKFLVLGPYTPNRADP